MKRIINLVLVAFVLVSCSSSNYEGKQMMAEDAYSDFDAAPGGLRIQAMSAMPMGADLAEEAINHNPNEGQKLIRTATLRVEVIDYETARQQVDSVSKRNRARVHSENLNNYDTRISNDMILKVPSQNLDSLIEGLQAIAKKVEYQGIETSDVTEEYIDVQSRLKNQKLVEQKFVSLLRRTDSIDEILKIESKLAEIRGQIESTEGRLKYLNNRVDYSTIYLNVYQRIEYKFEPEHMDSFWEQLKKSLSGGWKGLVVFMFFLIRLWPIWLIGIGGWLLYRTYLKRKKNGMVKSKKKKKRKIRGKANQNHKSPVSNVGQ